MITVIESGREKIFFTRCPDCASGLEYTLDDVEKKALGDTWPITLKYIRCPVCGKEVDAYLLTKDEQERIPPTMPCYPVGTCALQPKRGDTDAD